MQPTETGKRIQMMRKDKCWTQKDLADRICVSDKAVSKWERGLNYPDMDLLEPLSKALWTTVVELLGIENIPEQEKVEAVTAVAAEETARLRKEIRDRALSILIRGLIWLFTQFALGYILFQHGINDPLPRILTFGMSGFAGTLIGDALWIWRKHRK